MKNLFLAIAIVSALIGFFSHNELLDGFGKAFAGVFFILAYIVRVFGGEKIDWTGSSGH